MCERGREGEKEKEREREMCNKMVYAFIDALKSMKV
jgi:hypothetical protein